MAVGQAPKSSWGAGYGSGRGLPGKGARGHVFSLCSALGAKPRASLVHPEHQALSPGLVPGWRRPWGQAALEHPVLAKEQPPLEHSPDNPSQRAPAIGPRGATGAHRCPLSAPAAQLAPLKAASPES